MEQERIVSLLQRIKTPLPESGDDAAPPRPRARSVGEILRLRREELGENLAGIGEALRIKPTYLAAIEQGRAQDLPGPTYAIGFIRAYAHHLGLDGDRVLERYKAESAEMRARPDLSLPVALAERSLPGGPIVLAALILAACGYGTWYYLSTGERGRPERVAAVPAELQPAPTPAAAAPNDAPAAPAPALSPLGPANATPVTPAARAGAAPQPPAGSSPAAPPPSAAAPPASAPPAAAAPPAAPRADTGAAPGRVEIRALADRWIQIRDADQSIIFARVLKAGETYRVPARPGLLLRTGDAGSLAISVDGKPVPPIGTVGKLRRSVALDPEALIAGTAVRE
jgi:cytoskeleton protein RodZ